MQTYLQLCDLLESSKYGAVQCKVLYGSCQGTSDNHCIPHHVWSSSSGNSCYWYRWLDSGQFGINNCNPIGAAHSVRCVLGLKSIKPCKTQQTV